MGIKSIGHGLNRRRQNNAPWWARDIKAVVGFLGLVSVITLAFFSYATWLVYLLLQGLKLWFKGLIQHSQVFQEPTHLGLTWSRVLDWTKAWPGNQLNNPWLIWGILLGVIALSLSWYRIIRSYQSYNGFEKGAETFSSPGQLKKQYELIPDRNQEFEGYGGMLLVHYNGPIGTLIQSASYSRGFKRLKQKLAKKWDFKPSGTYGIDQTTVHSLIYGITRSGRGETIVLPLGDNLSRAKKQSSVIYQSHDDSGSSKFWNNSSTNLLNALILSQLDLAARHQTWARVTMSNIYRELTELGGKKFNSMMDLRQQRFNNQTLRVMKRPATFMPQ
ncbi:P-loop NTPase family protein [Lactiplantibacillus plantarum]|uniref:hypothetical protein n=1 Tax=Lactiplantibacillus plantarum TaxID=1590 RepID=UPI00093546BF|nr:hypothetical protein [Lactiplantibacillus plantarum]